MLLHNINFNLRFELQSCKGCIARTNMEHTWHASAGICVYADTYTHMCIYMYLYIYICMYATINSKMVD